MSKMDAAYQQGYSRGLKRGEEQQATAMKRSLKREQKLFDALKRISQFQPPEKVAREAEHMGLGQIEGLSFAYENMLTQAKRAVRGMRRPTETT